MERSSNVERVVAVFGEAQGGLEVLRSVERGVEGAAAPAEGAGGWQQLLASHARLEQQYSLLSSGHYVAREDLVAVRSLGSELKASFRGLLRYARDHPDEVRAAADVAAAAPKAAAAPAEAAEAAEASEPSSLQTQQQQQQQQQAARPSKKAAPWERSSRTLGRFLDLSVTRLRGVSGRVGRYDEGQQHAQVLAADTEDMRKRLDGLRELYSRESQDRAFSSAALRSQVAKTTASIDRIVGTREANARVVGEDASRRLEEASAAHEAQASALRERIARARAELAARKEEHSEEEAALKKGIKHLERQIESQVAVYDEEMTSYTAKVAAVRDLHTAESARHDDLAAKTAALEAERVDYEENVLKPRVAAEEARRRQEEAAAVIQRTFRWFCQKKAATKKSKKGKGKGKGKKK